MIINIVNSQRDRQKYGGIGKTAVKGVLYNQENPYSRLENQRRYWGQLYCMLCIVHAFCLSHIGSWIVEHRTV